MNKAIRIEKINAILAFVSMAGAYLIFKDKRICMSIGLGALIAGINFGVLYLIVTGLVAEQGGRLKFALFAVLKFLILVAILWAAVRFLPLNIAAFLAGLSTIVLAIFVHFIY
jgi:hypothetical protein